MTACRSCGVALCDCPDLAFAGLAPAEKVRTGMSTGPAVVPGAGSQVTPVHSASAAVSSFRGANGSQATDGAQVAGQSGLGADSLEIPLHEDVSK